MTALDERPTVSLDKPGREVVVRPDDELEVRPPAVVVPWRERATRARQACARATVMVADQPAVARTVAVSRQIPRATWRLSVCAPRGATRTGRALGRWLQDADSAALLARHAEAGEGESYARVAAARQGANLAGRRALAGGVAGVVALVAMAWWWPHVFAGLLAAAVFVGVLAVARSACREPKELAMVAAVAAGLAWVVWRFGPALAALIPQPPAWLWIATGVVALLVFGWLGRHEDRPIVEMPARAVPHKVPMLTAPMVIEALCSLGSSKMKDPDDVAVLMDPHRAGEGVQIDLELPRSVTAGFVMEKREEFAAALRRELGTVWPSVGRRHPGHLALFVSDQVMAESPQEPWPLLAAGQIDIFAAQPTFTDQLGKWIHVTFAYASMVIGSVPRMGKTFCLRQVLLTYGLDPRVKVIAWDGKGTGDLAPIALFAHGYVRGARVDKPEDVEKVRGTVRWLLTELGRRADAIAALPPDECPDSKITSELIDAHPELDLAPIVLGIDETQSFFAYGYRRDKEHKTIREELRDGIVELMKLGPAVGIWVILATQQVNDETIPTGASNNAVIRFALKMEGWEPNDKVLGTGAHKAGASALMFDFADKGVGIIKTEGARHVICRSVVGLDAVEARRIATRCRNLRLARGLLTGDAGDDGIEDAEIVIDVVADCALVIRQHARIKAQWSELVDWLRELRPENYAGLDVEELSARVRGAGIPVSQVWSSGHNGKGVTLTDLQRRGEL